MALDAPVSAEKTKNWLSQLPQELLEQETQLREVMEAFYAIHPLTVGDVVKVPPLVPHSLLHGVRTIEFQTPVYERKILSFAQKVLTQQQWDTEAALQEVELTTPPLSELELLVKDDLHHRELIVAFDHFVVERLHLYAGASIELTHDNVHRLIIGVVGEFQVGEHIVSGERALFIPASQCCLAITNKSSATAVLLLAIPCSETLDDE